MKIERRAETNLPPSPVVLVSVGEGRRANIITMAWLSIVNAVPPMVGIAMRQSRHSYALLSTSREFVVNIPRAADVDRVDVAGVVSGAEVGKIAELGFSTLPASKVKPPLIAECPINIECSMRHQLRLGTHDLLIGEIVATHYDEELLDEKGRLKPSAEVGLALVGNEYWSLGRKIAKYGAAGTGWKRHREGR